MLSCQIRQDIGPEGLLLPQVGENAVQIDLVYSRDDGAAQELACIIHIRLQLGKAFGQAEHIGQVVLQLIAKGIIRLCGGIMRPLHLEQTVDVFHGQDIFRNHDVDQADLLIPPELDVFEAVKAANAASGPLACVLCDESQFFTPEQAEQLFMITVDLNIPVICYGLRADFSLKGFPGSTRLLELAHTIEEMKTICTCGRKAICNCRKVNGRFVFEGEQVAIDLENDVQYVSMCPQCYFKARRAFYAAKKN